MTMPTFLVIGANKAGTTSLYYYLKQHPQIFMSPVKEPMFFSLTGKPVTRKSPGHDQVLNGATYDLESYQALFADVTNEIAIGEASTSYIHAPCARTGSRNTCQTSNWWPFSEIPPTEPIPTTGITSGGAWRFWVLKRR